jgi:DNA-binding NarL/FixJ family response regulator
MVRILIADDHEVIRAGLRRVLEWQVGWNVVAEASDSREAITKAVKFRPDVAVLDCSMPLINGIEATRILQARVPKTEVLIFTMHDNAALVRECLKAGARGYLLKTDRESQLLSAIEDLAQHKPIFTAHVLESLLNSFLRRPTPLVLSDREKSTVQLIAEGHTNKQIASILNISSATVSTQRAMLMRKLGSCSSAGIVRYAIRNGLVEP